jgi:hypothetical protein
MTAPTWLWFLVAIALVLAILWLVGIKVDVVT